MADIINTSEDRVFGKARKSVFSTVRAAVVNYLHYLLVDRKFDAERGVTIYPDFLELPGNDCQFQR